MILYDLRNAQGGNYRVRTVPVGDLLDFIEARDLRIAALEYMFRHTIKKTGSILALPEIDISTEDHTALRKLLF